MPKPKVPLIGTVVAVIAIAVVVASVLLLKTEASPSADETPRPARAEAATSYVMADGSANRTALRTCDHAPPPEQAEPGCFVLDRLTDSTKVTMRCWRDTAPPAGDEYRDHSPRWFYVTVGDSETHAGWNGWVYAPLVKDQTTVPLCNSDILGAYPLPAVKELKFDVVLGNCTTSGGELTAVSSGFTPGGTFTVHVGVDPSGWTVGESTGTVAADGSLPWRFACGNGEAAAVPYEIYVTDVESERSIGDIVDVPLKASEQPQAPPVDVPEPPADDGDNDGGENSSGPQPPQDSPPKERVISVFNQVTNGPTQMREDDQPAYLSTVTENMCRTRGCQLGGTEVGTGARLMAVCQTSGAHTTNGNNHDPADDNNPQRYESTLWYKVRWSDGRVGFISEVWIAAGDRGGRGLPAC